MVIELDPIADSVSSWLSVSDSWISCGAFQRVVGSIWIVGVLGLIAGMGTKLHSKAYFPGYYSRDLSNAGNGMWAVYDEGKSFQNGQVNDSFLASSTMDRYMGYNKEKVRQTILKHESVFREQLQELHRLYRRQRELMNDLGRRESHKFLLPAETTKPSLPTLQNSFKDDNNISCVSDSYVVKGKQGERIFGVEGNGSFPLEKNSSLLSKLDMNLCPRSVSNGQSNRDANRFVLNSKRNNKLVDLNEPIWVEESSTRDPVRNVEISVNLREDIKERDLHSCLGEKDGRNVFNTIQSESVKNGNWHLTFHSKAGNTRLDEHTSLSKMADECPSTFFELSQADPRENHDRLKSFVCDQTNEAPLRMRTIFGAQVSGGNQNRSTNSCYSPSSRPLIQRSDGMDSELSCISPRRKICSARAQDTVSAQENPGHHTLSPFTGRPPSSAMQMSELSGDKSTNNLRLRPSNLGASHQSAICFGSQSSVKQHGYLDLNTYVAAASNFQNKVIARQDSVFADARNHSTDKQLKTEVAYQMSLDSLQTRSHHFFNNTKITKGPFMDSTLATCGSDSERKRAADCNSGNNSTMSDFPTVHAPHFPKVLISPVSASKPIHNVSKLDCDGSSEVFTQNVKSISQHEETSSIANRKLNNHFSVPRPQIDLNLTLDEEETPSTPSVRAAVVRIPATEIDLEAPAVIGSATDVSFETDLLEKKTEKCVGVSLDDKYDELSRIAAEAIITISSSQLDLLDSTCQPPEASSPTRLLWLSEVISSYEGSDNESKINKVGLTKVDDTSDEETVPQGMDYFEFMTLNLQETKVEDYCTQPYVLDDCDDKDTRVTSVAKQGRKRQARRGRQLRDFQRDILPGLVSLSRREVTEDLQTIEEIFKASGQTWQSSFSQRRAGRNGRGRKRLVDLAPPQTAVSCLPPPVQQPTCRELEVEDRNLTGWGKRTRRLPRQRCSANQSAILNC
ncbi:hypothetical protein POM88_053323 [Heracleum sosnowskyi]|uniref:Uncharacterized protein n=1 Tax=Heracleum sosnowskyi TaxID=360622 RepID=A0AAD8LY21_9APIA|nr:hypothetical protein POM88_053323 [Heracleum sosnowskyi]